VIKRHRVVAHAALATGDLVGARENADAAVSAALGTEYLAYTADALADRASVLGASGDITAARADLETAAALYERKGHRVGSARVQELLSTLGRSSS
jgi:hypothetical protein